MDSQNGAMDLSKANGSPTPAGTAYIRVSLPETGITECLQFQLDEAVGAAKQLVIDRLGQNLKDPLNYGFYCPPINGKAGKFLQEERPLKDYPLSGPIGYLEFKYKRRVYRSVTISQTKLKKLHTKGNLRQFLEYVKAREVQKVTKSTQKGIDPNFHCRQTGETPLTLAVSVQKPRELIMALVSGGAHLDFRARDSFTPLHRAAVFGSYEAITTLLDLGQSPNCRTLDGLTPLYYVVSNSTESTCSDRLLYEHSILGVQDATGAQEIHQACRGGRVQHLQNLISYGADLNSQDNEGNTPLHVCAMGPQDSCARLLLFRGADRAITNSGGHSPYQVAILKSNTELADLIKNYSDADVVPIKGSPNFNRHRRSSIPSLRFNSLRTTSMHNLHADGSDSRNSGGTMPTGGPRARSGLGVSASVGKSMGSLAMSPDREDRGVREFMHSWGQNSVDGDSIAGNSLRDIEPFHMGYHVLMRHEGRYSNRSNLTGSLHYDAPNSRPSLLPLLAGETDNFHRTVVLQRGSKGFGFVLRGAKGANALDFTPSPEIPALQYFEKIDPDTPASKAGLLDGDFILEINGTSVVDCSHERAVQLIRKAGDTLALKVITVNKAKLQQLQQTTAIEQLDRTLAGYDVASMGSLRSQEGKTASIRTRASRNITESELQAVFARAGRPELPGSETGTGVKPEIVAAPKIYADADDIKTRLKANIAAHNEAEANTIHYARTTPSSFRPNTIVTKATVSEPPPPERQAQLPRHEWESSSEASPYAVSQSAEPHFNQPTPYPTPNVALNNGHKGIAEHDAIVDSSLLPEPVRDYSDSEPEPEPEPMEKVMYARPRPREPSPPPASNASVASSGSGQGESPSGGGLQAMLAAAVAKREMRRATAEADPPLPPPPPIYASSVSAKSSAPPPPPPPPIASKAAPPPPPPPPPLSIPKMSSAPPPPPPPPSSAPPPPPPAVPPAASTPSTSALASARSNLRSVSSNDASDDVMLRSPKPADAPSSNRPGSDHNAVLKAVVEQRRQMIESGSNPANEIETRLRNTRQLPKSMVFGAEAKPAPAPVVNGPAAPGARQVAAKSMIFGATSSPANKKAPMPPPPPPIATTANHKPPEAANQKAAAPAANTKPTVPTPAATNQKPAMLATNQRPAPTLPANHSSKPAVSSSSLATSVAAPPKPRPVAQLGAERQTSFLVQAEQLRRQMLERRQKGGKAPPPPPPGATSGVEDHMIVPPPDSFADLAGSPNRRGNSLFFGASDQSAPPTSPKGGDNGHMSML